MRARVRLVAPLAVLLLLVASCRGGQTSWLGPPQKIAPGIDFFSSADPTLLDPPGPVAVYMLRLDSTRARVISVLSHEKVLGTERVDEMAGRYGAVAAINGGFFNIRNGEPSGLLKVDGHLISDTRLPRGAVIIRAPPTGRTEIAFDQLTVK